MIEKGTYLRVQTRTREDVCGLCVWRVEEVGLKSPEPNRNENDGVKCVMVGGSGPAARAGWSVIDSEFKIMSEVKSGITQILTKEEGARMVAFYSKGKNASTPSPAKYGLGIEID